MLIKVFNTSPSNFRSKSLKILYLLVVWTRSINFHNLYVIEYLRDDQEIGVPLSVYCLNGELLRNKVRARLYTKKDQIEKIFVA